jgi:hypothetical protein
MISALPFVICLGFKTSQMVALIRIGYERCCVDYRSTNSRSAGSVGVLLRSNFTRRTTQLTRAINCAGILQKGRQAR